MTSLSRAAVVQEFLAAWREQGVDFLILRNYTALPDGIGNDIDILVRKDHRRSAERTLVALMSARGYALVNRVEFLPTSLFFAHLATGGQLHVDLFTTLKWRGFDILHPDVVLDAKIHLPHFSIPNVVHEATSNLLTRLLYGGYVKESYRLGIRSAYVGETREARQLLASTLGRSAAALLVELVVAGDWSTIEANANRWRQRVLFHQLIASPGRVIGTLASDAARLLRRCMSLPGIMLVLLGPDGSGKSSAARAVMDYLAPTFYKEKSTYVHWKPTLIRQNDTASNPTENPHGLPQRRPLVSLLFLFYHWLGFVIAGRLRFFPILFRNGLVVVDRYYHDILIDPRRYRLNVPKWVLRLGLQSVLRPDLIVCLDAPTSVLQSRKEEVSWGETDRQRREYVDLVQGLPNGHVIDATQPLAQVASDVSRTILSHMATRIANKRRRPTR